MSKSLSYQDVLLVPKYSELSSRALADTSVKFLGRKFKLPVIPANMLSVIDYKIAKYLSQNGYFYIYHRFGTRDNDTWDTVNFVREANKEKFKLISISTGVNNFSKNELKDLKREKLRIDFITVDVAHAHHKLVKDQIKFIKNLWPETKLIVGNIATVEAVKDLTEWGADAIKAGCGQGQICTTRFQTGFSIPMFSCIEECTNQHYWKENSFGIPELKQVKNCPPIIADGGVKTIGDIAKALVAGATMVMSGGLFVSCCDSPAPISKIDGKKLYSGSTSFEAKGHKNHIEGRTIEVNTDVSYQERLDEIKQALSSAISYAGGKDLNAFKDVEYVEI